MKKITLKEIQDNAKKHIQDFQTIDHSEVLKRLYKAITKIDFREKIKLKNEKIKVKEKQYLICCVENILEIARKNNWSICCFNETIYIYNSNYWNYIDKNRFQIFLGMAAEKMGIDKFIARHYEFREKLFKQFTSSAYMTKPDVNKDKVLINLKNGTFEIGFKKQLLRKPNSKDFITYQLPFDSNTTSTAPLFQEYLDKVLPEKELQMILAEYLAYVFVRPSTLKLEKVLLLYGSGANGKSVFFDIVIALLGSENVSSYSIKSLTDEKGNSRAMLDNKLLNYSSEISGKLDTAIFKQLVSGEPVEAKFLYRDPITLSDYAKLIFNCNELPKDIEQTHAFFRRFLIVPFRITIPENEQDKELSKKIIHNELSGIFNWVLDGLRRLLAQKDFTKSEIVNEVLKQYKKESDTVQLYLEDENYKKSVDESKPLKEIYSEYRTYCNDSGYHSCSIKTFSERLRKLEFVVERKNHGNIVFIKKDVA